MKKNIPPQQLGSPSDDGPRKLRVDESLAPHVPVLLDDTIRLLSPQEGDSYLDLTAGYGGHARVIGELIGFDRLTLVDRDSQAISYLSSLPQGAKLIHDDFVSAASDLVASNRQFDMVLVDLGVSSPQLDIASRGFSLKRDGPLDMRMDDRQVRTAADVVNYSSLSQLVDIITSYGEEPLSRARRIANAIVKQRPIHTTQQLAQVILSAHRGRYQKIHPATRTFQAIRIELNQEIQQITELLPLIPSLLRPGGRVAVISFHSLEDRLVKRYFKQQSQSGYEAVFSAVSKPIRGLTSDVHNPRSRSAVLRAAVKK